MDFDDLSNYLHIPISILKNDFYEPHIQEIMPQLWIGDQLSACSKSILYKHQIDTIFNCAAQVENRFTDEFRYYTFHWYDSTYDKTVKRQLKHAAQLLHDAMETNRHILVHCQSGHSRSATVIIAYLILYKRMSFEQAYEYVKTKRPLIKPNFQFQTYLKEIEFDIRAPNPTK